MTQPLTRRAWLALAAAAPALSSSETSLLLPDLGPRLDALWKRALNGSAGSSMAVIVSRVGLTALPPLRGWRDEKFLNAYIEWCDRPESAGFSGDVVAADLGPYDLVLVRSGAQFTVGVKTLEDPIRRTLLDPGPGNHRIPLPWDPLMTSIPPPLPLTGASLRPLPTIEAIVAASSDVVTLYGSGFEGSQFEIASEGGTGEILYSVHNQINARVPSVDRIRLTIDGSATPWVVVTKR